MLSITKFLVFLEGGRNAFLWENENLDLLPRNMLICKVSHVISGLLSIKSICRHLGVLSLIIVLGSGAVIFLKSLSVLDRTTCVLHCSSDLHVKKSTGIGNLSLPINVLIGVIPMVGSASWESLLGFFLFFFF